MKKILVLFFCMPLYGMSFKKVIPSVEPPSQVIKNGVQIIGVLNNPLFFAIKHGMAKCVEGYIPKETDDYRRYESMAYNQDIKQLQAEKAKVEKKLAKHKWLPMRYEHAQLKTIDALIALLTENVELPEPLMDISARITPHKKPPKFGFHSNCGASLEDFLKSLQTPNQSVHFPEDKLLSNVCTIYDLKTTTALDSDWLNKQKFERNDLKTFCREISQALDELQQAGLYTAEQASFFTTEFINFSAKNLIDVASHPVSYVQNFVNANLEIAKELALISIDITTIVDSRFPDEVRQEAHMRMQDRVETITTLYEGACQKIPEMSRTEWAQLSSRIFSDYLVFKGAGKGWHLAKEIPTAIQESRFLNHIYSRTASILETMPEVATAEGMVFKVSKGMEETSTLMHEAEKVLITETIKPLDYTHSVAQYELLKATLQTEEFTSIIKVTKHGLERLIERGFEASEVLDLIKKPSLIKIQADGSKAFVKELSTGRYNLLVINEQTEKVITALKNISLNKLQNIGQNYGWEIK